MEGNDLPEVLGRAYLNQAETERRLGMDVTRGRRRRAVVWLLPAAITLATAGQCAWGATKAEINAKYQELVDRFESEKGRPDFERSQTVLDFGDAPSPKTVRFLAKLLKSERQTLWGSIAQALGKIGSLEAVRSLVTDAVPLLESKQLHVLAEFALKGPWDAKAEKWLLSYALKGKNRKDPETYAVMLRTVAGLKTPKKLALLAKEAKTAPTPELQAYLLETIEAAADKKAVSAAAELVRSRDQNVQAAALAVLATAKSARHRRVFVKGLKSPYRAIRAICIEGLSQLKDEQVLGYATELLADEDPRVQVAAIRALMHRGGSEAMQALVAAMSTVHTRVLDDLTDALTRLTGKTLGPAAVQWESWWAVNKEKGLSFTAMTAKEFSRLKSESGKDDDKVTVGRYYGVRVLSEQTAFIIDGSKSMEEPFLGRTAVANEASRTSRQKPPPTRQLDKQAGKKKNAQTRMTVAKKELQQLLKVLKETQHFNIFRFDTFFENFAVSAMGQSAEVLVPLSDEARSRATAFVNSLQPNGMTNISAVLKESFRSRQVDTIFLLTDGGPTSGITDYEQLLAALRRWNRHRRVRINTFGFQLEDAERRLLLDIAEQNYGVFVDI